jgi:hypothetical protein
MDNSSIIGRYDPNKWIIYYDWGNSFWGNPWCDRDDGVWVYETKSAAESEAFLMIAEHPDLFIGKVSVVPCFERYRRDFLLKEAEERERREEEERIAFDKMMAKRIEEAEEALRKQGWSIKKG